MGIVLIIIKVVTFVRRIFHSPSVPAEYRANFKHLYFDIAWYGLLAGSAVNFLNVYAARLGASGMQIGLLGAMPSLVMLGLAIPTGQWLEKRPIGKAVFWTAALQRFGYLLWIPLPWLLGKQGQVWALVGIVLLMGIPMTVVSVGFNAVFAAAVPPDWRAYVAGIRNVLLALTFMLSSLGCGYLLDALPFPIGYQVVFGIGFLGGAMSTLNLFFIKLHPVSSKSFLPDPAPVRPVEKRVTTPGWRGALRLDVWKTPFRNILLVMLGFHLAQYLASPLFALYNVNQLRLTDANIGLGTALFYLTMLIGSTQLDRVSRRWNHHKVTGWGVLLLFFYPAALALSRNALHYYLVSAIGGIIWAMVAGAQPNYLLENIPAHDRPAYLAWYNIILNACILVGSLAGPFLAGYIGLSAALILFGVLRFLAGVAILKWG